MQALHIASVIVVLIVLVFLLDVGGAKTKLKSWGIDGVYADGPIRVNVSVLPGGKTEIAELRGGVRQNPPIIVDTALFVSADGAPITAEGARPNTFTKYCSLNGGTISIGNLVDGKLIWHKPLTKIVA